MTQQPIVAALRCMMGGCEQEGFECLFPDDSPVQYCSEHAFAHGFCKLCGMFNGGIESFEFLNGGYCDECKAELDAEDGFNNDEPDDDWDPDR